MNPSHFCVNHKVDNIGCRPRISRRIECFAFMLAISLLTLAPANGIEALAHPEVPMAAQQTLVWTPLFQASWDELHKGKDLLRVEPPNALMERLDEFKWEASTVLPQGGWKVWAGSATEEFMTQVNREAASLSGHTMTFALEPLEGHMVLGLLIHRLNFARAFYRSQKHPMLFQSQGKESPVRFFGVRGKLADHFRGNVRVLRFQESSHALSIEGSNKESVVLYRPESPVDFATACARLREWLASQLEGDYGALLDPRLHEQDDLRIPLIKLETMNDFLPQLSGLRDYQNESLPWRIHHARQWIKFELTERGAEVKTRVVAASEPFGEPQPQPKIFPRRFFYDGPFFVFLWRNGAEWPYFGTWVGDTTALEAFSLR